MECEGWGEGVNPNHGSFLDKMMGIIRFYGFCSRRLQRCLPAGEEALLHYLTYQINGIP